MILRPAAPRRWVERPSCARNVSTINTATTAAGTVIATSANISVRKIGWTRPGGGLWPASEHCLQARKNFLMPARALSGVFAAKFRDGIKKT